MLKSLAAGRPGLSVPRRARSAFRLAVLLAACLLATTFARAAAAEKKVADATARIRATVEFLADDDMQGRGLGTNGLDRAAGYIGQELIRIGLKTDLCDGGPFQTFTVPVTSEGRQQQVDWLSALMQAGIKHDADNGAAVKPGDEPAKDAAQQGRVPQKQGSGPPLRSGPATRTRRLEPATQPQHLDPATRRLHPATRESTAPKHAKPRTARIKNVVAALEGHGPRADETIVIGAHYDHLGQRRGADGELVVYNGANDNASGTAALLEIARILSSRKEKLPRRIVFVAFSGEELGLLGSLHYVSRPPVPLTKTIAMINLDMVGRLENDSLAAMGTGSSPAMAERAERTAREHGIRLLPIPLSMPCSDHSPFHAHAVPVIFFGTLGGMRDYHRPTDTAEKLNYEGIRRIAAMTSDLVVAVAEADERPKFVDEGLPAALLRGAVRLFGDVASEMLAEPAEKTEEATPAHQDDNAPAPDKTPTPAR